MSDDKKYRLDLLGTFCTYYLLIDAAKITCTINSTKPNVEFIAQLILY